MNLRGFIGPLGDDFPAIFPIALGLMFFFGAIAITYDVYNYKSTQANLIRANIMISRSVRAQTLMSPDYWEFQACPLITEIQANYGVSSAMMLERAYYFNEELLGEDDPDTSLSLDRPFFMDGSDRPALCPESDDYDDWVEEAKIPLDDPNRRILSLSYPVLVNMEWDGTKYVGCVPEEGVRKCEQKTVNLVIYTWE